jgi:hypothetical protein
MEALMADQQEREAPQHATTRRYRSRGVEVEIREAKDHVELMLDGIPINVSIIDGQFHSQLANQFKSFATIEEVVDTLLANEGRTWVLHSPGTGHGGGGHGPHTR